VELLQREFDDRFKPPAIRRFLSAHPQELSAKERSMLRLLSELAVVTIAGGKELKSLMSSVQLLKHHRPLFSPSGSKAGAICRCCSTSGQRGALGAADAHVPLEPPSFFGRKAIPRTRRTKKPSRILRMLDVYAKCGKIMACPSSGRKTQSEKFAGAVPVTPWSHDAKRTRMQAGTSHDLGQNFGKHSIEFQNKEGQLDYVANQLGSERV